MYTAPAMTLEEANACAPDRFVAVFGGVFEHSPWVAQQAVAARPFASVAALHAAMLAAVRAASMARQLALLRAHPELAGREAAEGSLTPDSGSEQGRLGFNALGRDELGRIAAINHRYRERHGFPCIVALALHATRASAVAEMARRAEADPAGEMAAAIEQVGHIARARLERMISP